MPRELLLSSFAQGGLVSFAVRAFRKFLKCSDGLQRHIFSDDLHVAHDRRVEDLRIAARHVDFGMAEHLGDVVDCRTAGQCQGCERMARAM